MKVTKTQKATALSKLASGKTTTVELAKKYNVHPSTISKWKIGTEYEKTPKSTRVSKKSAVKTTPTKTSMLKSTKASFSKGSSKSVSTDSYKSKYDKIKSDFDNLKKSIKSIYRMTLTSKF